MAAVTANRWRNGILTDYISLAKPLAILPHFVTAASAMFLAISGLPPGLTLLFTLAGGGLVAAASNILNCYFDRHLDGLMTRTRERSLPAGRLKPYQALIFGIITGFAGLLILSLLVGLAAAALAAIALLYYVVVYTLWLKRRTRWSAVIGSGAGAITPLIGWAAVTSRVELTPFLLFAIISLWTLPHFWALAIAHRHDYECAGLEALPQGYGVRLILASSLLLIAVTLALVPAAGLGPIYLAAACLLAFGLLERAVRLLRAGASPAAQHLYVYSIVYIVVLFAAMIADRLFSYYL